MRRLRLRLFRGRSLNPTLDGVGAALEESFDIVATDAKMEAELDRLIGELKKVEHDHGR